LILQRGYLNERNLGHVEDQRIFTPAIFSALYGIELWPYQKNVLDQAKVRDQGILDSPTGRGKSIMDLSLIGHCGKRSMILTHSKSLMYRWCDVIRGLMKIDPGMIGDGNWQEGEQMSVGMLQTLSNRGTETREIARGHGVASIDECHHIPAATFSDEAGATMGTFASSNARWARTDSDSRWSEHLALKGMDNFLYRFRKAT
jgi:superfamily II DNA or RNA helicase